MLVSKLQSLCYFLSNVHCEKIDNDKYSTKLIRTQHS
jgi:hypothetical protein